MDRGAPPRGTYFLRSFSSPPPSPPPAATMPLPVRNLSGVHLSVNPALAGFHAVHPLSMCCSLVGVLKLFKLSLEGVPLAAIMDVSTWMNLACLDDAAADYCLDYAASMMRHGCKRSFVNDGFAHAAAPYLVPMLVPATGYTPSYTPGYAKHAKHAQHAQHAQHAPRDTALLASEQSSSHPPTRSTSSRKSQTAESQLQGTAETAESQPRGQTAESQLHGSVMRVICALAKEYKVSIAALQPNFEALAKMQAGDACKALREFAKELVDSADTADKSSVTEHEQLARVLARYTS